MAIVGVYHHPVPCAGMEVIDHALNYILGIVETVIQKAARHAVGSVHLWRHARLALSKLLKHVLHVVVTVGGQLSPV